MTKDPREDDRVALAILVGVLLWLLLMGIIAEPAARRGGWAHDGTPLSEMRAVENWHTGE